MMIFSDLGDQVFRVSSLSAIFDTVNVFVCNMGVIFDTLNDLEYQIMY